MFFDLTGVSLPNFGVRCTAAQDVPVTTLCPRPAVRELIAFIEGIGKNVK